MESRASLRVYNVMHGLGSRKNRSVVLGALKDLPQVPVATHDEVLQFIEKNALFGLEIGYVDAHLLAAVRLAPAARLWTRDKRLHAASAGLDLAYIVAH